MQKPISLMIEDTKKELGKVINESGLPLYVLLPMVRDLYAELQQLYAQYSKQEQEAYFNALAESGEQE